MHATNARVAAAIAALAAGGVSAFALTRPSTHQATQAASRQAAVEVRTQVIRRTIHVVRHERPPRPKGSVYVLPRGGGVRGTSPPARTASSGAHRSSGVTEAAASPVRTRSSSGASRGGSARPIGANTPVRTRTSGAKPTGGGREGAAVRTRTSGGHGHDDGGQGRDD
jgi:hypothetical protein